MQAAELLRSLAEGIGHMRQSFRTGLLKGVHGSAERLQRSVDMHSYLFALCRHEAPAKPPSNDNDDDKGDKNSFTPAAKLSTYLSFGRNSSGNLLPPAPAPAQGESYHEMMKRQQRRLHSWPSREVDDFEEDVGGEAIPRMRALESTAALSLATFASLLIEFVARLDHLVEAVDELAKMANFRQEIIAC